MKASSFLLVALLSLCLGNLTMANISTPYPDVIYEKQPDGSTVEVRLIGHPYHGVFQTDELGHPVVRDEEGWYVYALHQDTKISPTTGRQHLIPSDRVVGLHPPPYNTPPDLGTLSSSNDLDEEKDHIYRHLLPEEMLEENTNPTVPSWSRINDMLCDGMPRSQWCPENPIDIKSLGRTSATTSTLDAGVLNLIVILVKFSDQKNRPTSPVTDYERLFTDPTWGPTGSASTYFESMSGGKFKLKVHVEDWTVSPNSEEYWSFGRYGTTAQFANVANEGLNAMDRRGTDWSQYDQNGDGIVDGLFIIHSGYAAEGGGADSLTGKAWGPHRIWSHRSAIGSLEAWKSTDRSIRVGTYATTSAFLRSGTTHITRIGVVVHEMGHILGLPDMMMSGPVGSGVAHYDVMGNMWGRDVSQLYPGLLSAWSRIQLGWAIPVELKDPGVYEISAAIYDPTTVYKISHGFPDGEYLLIENRIREGCDLLSYDEGLLVWHIDETMEDDFMTTPGYPGQVGWPWNGRHYQLAIMQADQSYGLERGDDGGSLDDMYKSGMADLGPGTCHGCSATVYPNTDTYSSGNVQSTGVRLSAFSDPGRVMTFTFSIDGVSASSTKLVRPLPTPSPTFHPSPLPTRLPTPLPTSFPTKPPSPSPSRFPTRAPTAIPTLSPSLLPKQSPTTRKPTPIPTTSVTQLPTRSPTRQPTPSPIIPMEPSSLSPEASLASDPPRFDSIIVDGDPDWWPRISSTFVGTPELKQCSLRDEVPITGSSCGQNPKTCFFGTKYCLGLGASPAVRCVCEERSWTCVVAKCKM